MLIFVILQVDFVPNLDNSQKEPSLLPARISSLLLNDSSGIAVGMATNIPPHNLGELVDALSVIIQNPEATKHPASQYGHSISGRKSPPRRCSRARV